MPNENPIIEETHTAMSSALGRPRTVLDVGCGIGLNGAAARMTGASVVGIKVGFSKLRKLAGTVWTFIRLAKTLKVGDRGSGHYEVWDRIE